MAWFLIIDDRWVVNSVGPANARPVLPRRQLCSSRNRRCGVWGAALAKLVSTSKPDGEARAHRGI
jgi:hypothetical protein